MIARGQSRAADLGSVSVVDALVARLHERIAGGDIAPGAQVTEGMLVSDFGVSRPTARSAIATTVTMGLLHQEPNKAATVPLVTGAAVRDLYRVRVPLELEAVRVLASHEVALTSEARGSATRLATLGDAPLNAFVAEDLRFHRALMMSTGSDQLYYHWSLLEMGIELAMLQAQRDIRADLASEEHLDIVTAIETGNLDDAERKARDHLSKEREEIAFRVSVGAWRVPHASA